MLPTRVLHYGKDEPLPQRVSLHAGPLSLFWEDGDLRYIKLGDHEVLRRIYIATRDRNWGTVPNVMSDLVMDVQKDAFRISYNVENRQSEILFTWHGEIAGESDGTIRFSMDGIARSTSLKNRIGFCVLHPADIAGAPARVAHTDDTTEEGTLPIYLVPDQPVLPFAEMRRMAHQVTPGIWAELEFEGDIFEMEDQRNWTDASYKTFCTPLRIPYPVEIAAGTDVQQSVTLSLRREGAGNGAVFSTTPSPLTFIVEASATAGKLPPIGLGVASHGGALSERELSRLKALGLSHLRVDLRLADLGYAADLRCAAAEAAALRVPLEIALHVTAEAAAAELTHLRTTLDELKPAVSVFLVHPAREIFRGGTPVAEVLAAAREHLGGYPGARFGAGTDADYIFMARSMPPLDKLDVLSFAICPQVHAFDNASLTETLGAQAYAVTSARRLAGSVPVIVSPVTLKMRHNPYATGAIPATPPGELPPQVDPRQMSLFAAGWTAASIKYVAQSGVASVTFFETTGWRGVMETAQGAPVPDKFRSIPGAVFPVYHVLADVGQFVGGEVISTRSSHALTVDGLALRKDGMQRVLVANMTAEQQTVNVRGLPAEVWIRMLDAANAEDAMQAPLAYRARPGVAQGTVNGNLTLALPPYAVARLDSQPA